MSNRAKSKKHGMHRIERIRAKAKVSKRQNKANNHEQQVQRQQAIQEAIVASGK